MPAFKPFLLILFASLILFGTTSGVPMVENYGPDTPSVNAYWLGPEIIITEENEAVNQAVAFNSKKVEYLVVWQWPDGIYGQRINRFGELLEPLHFPISTSSEARDFPDVAYDPVNNRYLVVWNDEGSGATPDYDISGRFIPWEGPETSVIEFKIDTRPANTVHPQVIYNAAKKEFMVMWTEATKSTLNTSGVRVQSSDGSQIGGVKVIAGASGTDRADAAFNTKNGQYLLVRDKYNGGGSPNFDVLGTLLTGELNQILADFGIAGWPDDEQSARVAACRVAGDYLVAWQSTGNSDIYARAVSKDGIPSGIVHNLSDTNNIVEGSPDIACDAAGKNFFTVWEKVYSSTANTYGVWGRLVDSGGGTDPAFEIIAPTSGYPRRWEPVAAGGDNQYIVVWENACDNCGRRTLHARIIYFTEEPPGKVYIYKHTQPRYTGGSFHIHFSGGPISDFIMTDFYLKDDDVPFNSGPIKAGEYSSTEILYDRWDYVNATCSDGSPIHAIKLDPAEVIACTFVNKYPVKWEYLPLVFRNK
jgi:hypothetical protein